MGLCYINIPPKVSYQDDRQSAEAAARRVRFNQCSVRFYSLYSPPQTTTGRWSINFGTFLLLSSLPFRLIGRVFRAIEEEDSWRIHKKQDRSVSFTNLSPKFQDTPPNSPRQCDAVPDSDCEKGGCDTFVLSVCSFSVSRLSPAKFRSFWPGIKCSTGGVLMYSGDLLFHGHLLKGAADAIDRREQK